MPIQSSDSHHLAAIMRADMFLPSELKALLTHFNSAARLRAAPAKELATLGLSLSRAERFVAAMRYLDPLAEAVRLEKTGVEMITESHPAYPPLLKFVPDAPPALFVRGQPAALAHPFPLSVVGSRRMTDYGCRAVRLLIGPCARAGAMIVSGLAYGIDAAAHEEALAAGGLTVAVLASGVDRASVGPRGNFALAERLIKNGGCLVSEYPPGLPADKRRFPQRNRLIAGLSRVTLVVEAAEKSGSLITARHALDFDREVFAVPGPIGTAGADGTNRLIAAGARPALTAAELLEELGLVPNREPPPATSVADPAQRTLLAALKDGPTDADALAARTTLPIRRVLASLSALEEAGLAFVNGGFWSPLPPND